MSFELILAWGIHGILAIVLIGSLIPLSRPNSRSKLVYRFSQKVQLPLITDAIAAAAKRRIRHRTGSMMIGGLVGLLVSAIVLYLNPLSASAFTIWLVTLPLLLTGMCGGGAVVALRESLFRRPPDAVRVARAVTVTLGDYLSPRRLRTPPALILTAGALCLVGFALGLSGLIDSNTFLRSPALPLLLAALLLLGVGGLLAHRVLRQPQLASSELELAWDDAFRAETLRSLWLFGSSLAWLAASTVALGMLQGLDAIAGTTWSLGLGGQLFNWGFLVILFAFSFGLAQNYFRFRLWPELSFENPKPLEGPVASAERPAAP